MPLRSRRGNWRAMKHCLPETVEIPCSYIEELYNEDCIGNPDVLALNEVTPAFDAANTLRADNNIIYLVSNSGNVLGSELLQNQLDEAGCDAEVHLLKDCLLYTSPSPRD